MTWWMSALGAAIIWGVHYPLIDKALDHLSSYTVLLLTVLPILILYPFFHTQVNNDIIVFGTLDVKTKVMILGILFTSISASFLVFHAIASSNATLASLIEITYPVFVVLFAFLILGENHLSGTVIIGGLLIMLGTGLIIWSQ